MRWVIHRLDSGPRKLLGRSPSAAPAQLRTGVGVQCRPSWAAVVGWIGGHLGGHSLAKYRAPTGWLHWAGRPGRLPTSVGTVTARSPWLLSRKNVEAAHGELTTSCPEWRLRSIAELSDSSLVR